MAAIQTIIDNISLKKPRKTDTIIDTKIMTNIKPSKSFIEDQEAAKQMAEIDHQENLDKASAEGSTWSFSTHPNHQYVLRAAMRARARRTRRARSARTIFAETPLGLIFSWPLASAASSRLPTIASLNCLACCRSMDRSVERASAEGSAQASKRASRRTEGEGAGASKRADERADKRADERGMDS